MKRYSYIFWDLDGTVIDTYEGVEKSLAPAFSQFGIDWEGKDFYRFIGPPMRRSIPRWTGVSAETAEEIIAKFRERYNTIGVFECSPFPGARQALCALHEAGFRQVIASSKPEDRCRQIMDRFELSEFLDEIVGASADGRIDAKIEVLEEAFSRLRGRDPDFSVSDAVLIGDTMHDADGAREAGIDCIGVSYGFGGREELQNHGVSVIYDDLASLTEDFLRTRGNF